MPESSTSVEKARTRMRVAGYWFSSKSLRQIISPPSSTSTMPNTVAKKGVIEISISALLTTTEMMAPKTPPTAALAIEVGVAIPRRSRTTCVVVEARPCRSRGCIRTFWLRYARAEPRERAWRWALSRVEARDSDSIDIRRRRRRREKIFLFFFFF